MADDEWGDAAVERSTIQNVKLDDGTVATEVGVKERDEVDEERDYGDDAPGSDVPAPAAKLPKELKLSPPQTQARRMLRQRSMSKLRDGSNFL